MSRHKAAARRLAEILSNQELAAGERLDRAEEILREHFPLPPKLTHEQLVEAGRRGGAAGRGKAKRRGDKDYYSRIRAGNRKESA